jgi:cupin fold WbuC family metalloprotein
MMKLYLHLPWINPSKMKHIDLFMINSLVRQARASERKRKNLNFHTLASDPLHRMLHAMEPETYVQPHKHENPDKREAFVILKGKVAALEFTPDGELADWTIMDPVAGNFGVEFNARTWHSLIALETGSVVFEVKDGPWDPADDKFFAGWAPKEGEAGCKAYNQKLLEKMGYGKI